jgi:hypothetical protein
MVIDQFLPLLAAGELGLVHAGGQAQVADREPLPTRVAAEAKRAVGAAQVAAAEVRIAGGGHGDVRRHVLARPEFVGRHASQARVDQGRAGPVAGEHAVLAAAVVHLGVRHAANDG